MPRATINERRALELADQGLGHAEIGRAMAQEEGRRIQYQAASIKNAIARERARQQADAVIRRERTP